MGDRARHDEEIELKKNELETDDDKKKSSKKDGGLLNRILNDALGDRGPSAGAALGDALMSFSKLLKENESEVDASNNLYGLYTYVANAKKFNDLGNRERVLGNISAMRACLAGYALEEKCSDTLLSTLQNAVANLESLASA